MVHFADWVSPLINAGNAPLLKKTTSVQAVPAQDNGEIPGQERYFRNTKEHDGDARLAHLKGFSGSSDPPRSSNGVINDYDDTVVVDDEYCRRSVSQDERSRSSEEDEQHDRTGESERLLSRASYDHSDTGKCRANVFRDGATAAQKGSTSSSGNENNDDGDGQESRPSCQSGTRRREKYVAVETEKSGDGRKELPDNIRHGGDPESNTSKHVEEGDRQGVESAGSEKRSWTSDAECDDIIRSFTTGDKHRRSDSCSSIGVESDLDKKSPSGEHSVDKHGVKSDAGHDDVTEQQDLHPLGTDDDDESTINLDDGHDVGHEQRQNHERRNEPCIISNEAGQLSPHVAESKHSNEDDEGEVTRTEEGDIEMSAPSFELSWERSRPSGTTAFRLHPHISRAPGEGEGSRHAFVLPPPKEFLSDHPSNSQSSGRCGQPDSSEAKDIKRGSVAKSSVKGRRRSAADLEWSDGEQPRQVNDTETAPCFLHLENDTLHELLLSRKAGLQLFRRTK